MPPIAGDVLANRPDAFQTKREETSHGAQHR